MSRPVNISSSSLVSRKLPIFSREQERIRWFEENKSWLLKGVGIFVVIVVIGLSIVAYQRHQSSLAREQLRLGIAGFQAGKWEEAILHLEKAKSLFGSGDRAKVANFYLIEASIRQGQFDHTQDLVTPPEKDYLSQIILLTQGRNAEKQNDPATARKLYAEAAAIGDGPLGADALLGVARMAESAGEIPAATAARQEFLTKYPNSPFADIIRQKIEK